MKRMEINTEDLDKWVTEGKFLYADHNDRRNKKRVKLWVTYGGEYVVSHGDEQIYRGRNPGWAVMEFNEII